MFPSGPSLSEINGTATSITYRTERLTPSVCCKLQRKSGIPTVKKPKMTLKDKELGILASQPKGRAFITLLGRTSIRPLGSCRPTISQGGTSNSLRLEIQLTLGAAGGDRSWSTASPPSALCKTRKGLRMTFGVAGDGRRSTTSFPSTLGVLKNRWALVAVGGHPRCHLGMSLRLSSALRLLLGRPKG